MGWPTCVYSSCGGSGSRIIACCYNLDCSCDNGGNINPPGMGPVIIPGWGVHRLLLLLIFLSPSLPPLPLSPPPADVIPPAPPCEPEPLLLPPPLPLFLWVGCVWSGVVGGDYRRCGRHATAKPKGVKMLIWMLPNRNEKNSICGGGSFLWNPCIWGIVEIKGIGWCIPPRYGIGS